MTPKLEDNDAIKILGFLGGLQKLRSLTLRNNNLTAISAGEIVNLKQLTSLNLSEFRAI